MSKDLTVPPTAIARRYVRYVTGFGVGVAIGVAPFLGKIKVPGFSALLELFPLQLQNVLVPLSAFLMGLVVVAIQFYAREKIVRASLRRWFKWGFAVIVTGLVTFLVLHVQFVRTVTTEKSSVAVVVTDTRLGTCLCDAKRSDQECIESLSFDRKALATCWGGQALLARELLLMLTYLLLTGGFGALLGLLMLQEEAKRAAKRSPLPRSRRKAPASPTAAPLPTPPGTLPPAGPSP